MKRVSAKINHVLCALKWWIGRIHEFGADIVHTCEHLMIAHSININWNYSITSTGCHCRFLSSRSSLTIQTAEVTKKSWRLRHKVFSHLLLDFNRLLADCREFNCFDWVAAWTQNGLYSYELLSIMKHESSVVKATKFISGFTKEGLSLADNMYCTTYFSILFFSPSLLFGSWS